MHSSASRALTGTPEYHVAAAGSLLGVAMRRAKYSFLVGKVDMHPMGFEVFLWTAGAERFCGLIGEACESFSPLSLHEKVMDLYRTYLAVGGMPCVVWGYVERRDFDFVAAMQRTLNDSYIADMAKYAAPQETARIMAAWASILEQLAKENRKFQYRVISRNARASQYESALDWMAAADIINKCVLVSAGKLPLAAYAKNEAFKVYMFDTGLICSKMNIAADAVINSFPGFDGFKGTHSALKNGITSLPLYAVWWM